MVSVFRIRHQPQQRQRTSALATVGATPSRKLRSARRCTDSAIGSAKTSQSAGQECWRAPTSSSRVHVSPCSLMGAFGIVAQTMGQHRGQTINIGVPNCSGTSRGTARLMPRSRQMVGRLCAFGNMSRSTMRYPSLRRQSSNTKAAGSALHRPTRCRPSTCAVVGRCASCASIAAIGSSPRSLTHPQGST